MSVPDLPETPPEIVVAPIFPLPNVVMPPGTQLPLHIFEPRYRAMLAHALGSNGYIAMALQDPRQKAGTRVPALHPVLGLGGIVGHQPLPDGRSNIVLRGLSRCEVIDFEDLEPFLLAKLRLVATTISDPAAARLAAIDLMDRLSIEGPDLGSDSPQGLPGQIADQITAQMPVDVLTRQQVFAIRDDNLRLQALQRLVDGLANEVSPDLN